MGKAIVFGIDIGTTSVSGVAVDVGGNVVASKSIAHHADVEGLEEGICEQDPERLMLTARSVISALREEAGVETTIGWTGQMHGVVGVDEEFKPVTNLVTWRDARRYGGMVLTDWYRRGVKIHKALPVCGLMTGKNEIDRTFLHSWYLDMEGVDFPKEWLPEVTDCKMVGDNQAGVIAAQKIFPGCAVVNLGTSGQLSIVRDRAFLGKDIPGEVSADGSRREMRPYPGNRTLECRASMIGGFAWAKLHDELGISWEAMNQSKDARIVECADRIVGDLFGDVDLSGVTGLIGVGNALVRNAALRGAVERKSGMECRIPSQPEMAAYGAALLGEGLRGLRLVEV